MAEVLIKGYRGELLETVNMGNIAIVDEKMQLKYSAGDPSGMTYYRSCSKPLQALPIFLHKLDEKYGLTQKELAIFCASHLGEPFHVETVLGILKKGGFVEEDFIMIPTYPTMKSEVDKLMIAGMPTRKVYHNCTGKHSALLLMAKETGEDYHNYYKLESRVQQEILDCIAKVAQWPKEKIITGIDGCGVPVYAVPLDNMAYSYLKLACPDVETDEGLSRGLAKYFDAMHAHPEMIRGTGSLCTALNGDPNIVAKLGADGVYTIGLRKERLGIAIKMMDGLTNTFPMIVKEIFRQIGYENEAIYAQLDKVFDKSIYNNNNTVIGERVADFKLTKHN